ncbi:retrograde cargo receptor ERV46 Ecym_5030 [Eremothecium cymbalariae DBVPG|uniref:Endoplasmic reticulum-Golgi intermediate compartment protein n=1 Tax=Eremothecium cymbalariae (strain CBS 270.75 / DBVPG 7215 / KCTC 17166 / NRRL Y-17582) TaxID=931890 RepID=I6NCN8_ERECY|nr:hypothetical protein Ecym_5030 [Eremothecium cymbalariae DBVPG\
MSKSSLLSFDAFAKTEEDVRVRTKAGGIISLGCIVVTLLLLFNEWSQFNTVIQRPQLVLDRDRRLKMDLNLDFEFSNMPCAMLNLDVMDTSGEVQLDLQDAGFTKTRLDHSGTPIRTEKLEVGSNKAVHLPDDPNYCGSCYGSKSQDNNDALPKEQKVCCQTCEEVREAYSEKGWAFFDGQKIEQCIREGYVEKINSQLHEGCRVKGSAKLNRIQGNIHFAPGRTTNSGKRTHTHDVSLYDTHSHLNFNHIIHKLSFGSDADGALSNPLDGHKNIIQGDDAHFSTFSYFTKIVPTRYEYLDGRKLETTQFSVTTHSRPLKGGKDDDHPNTIHHRGGIAGVTIFFEMSPLKVINSEKHAITWSGFVLNCITSIGSVLAVGTVIDKITYRAQRSIWGKKSQ